MDYGFLLHLKSPSITNTQRLVKWVFVALLHRERHISSGLMTIAVSCFDAVLASNVLIGNRIT